MELCYANNPHSLFRKYALLITRLTRHQLFRDYLKSAFPLPQEQVALLLPHGYIQKTGEKTYRLVVTTRSIYSPKLYSALYALDTIAQFIEDFREAEKFLVWQLGLINHIPDIVKSVHFNRFVVSPDASPETTSVDGYAARTGVDEVFSTIRGGAGTTSSHTIAASEAERIAASATVNQFTELRRGIFLFDTSPISASAYIANTSKFSIYVTTIENGLGDAISLTNSNPASNTTIVNGDYSNVGTTLYATTASISGLALNAYNDFILNATGIAAINGKGITKMGLENESDRANSSIGWLSNQGAGVTVDFADNGANKPRLTVDYAPGLFLGNL